MNIEHKKRSDLLDGIEDGLNNIIDTIFSIPEEIVPKNMRFVIGGVHGMENNVGVENTPRFRNTLKGEVYTVYLCSRFEDLTIDNTDDDIFLRTEQSLAINILKILNNRRTYVPVVYNMIEAVLNNNNLKGTNVDLERNITKYFVMGKLQYVSKDYHNNISMLKRIFYLDLSDITTGKRLLYPVIEFIINTKKNPFHIKKSPILIKATDLIPLYSVSLSDSVNEMIFKTFNQNIKYINAVRILADCIINRDLRYYERYYEEHKSEIKDCLVEIISNEEFKKYTKLNPDLISNIDSLVEEIKDKYKRNSLDNPINLLKDFSKAEFELTKERMEMSLPKEDIKLLRSAPHLNPFGNVKKITVSDDDVYLKMHEDIITNHTEHISKRDKHQKEIGLYPDSLYGWGESIAILYTLQSQILNASLAKYYLTMDSRFLDTQISIMGDIRTSVKEYRNSLFDMIHSQPVNREEDFVVYSGISYIATHTGSFSINNFKKGETITNINFRSTSISPEIAIRFYYMNTSNSPCCLLRIIIKRNSRSYLCVVNSSEFSNENEIILNVGSTLTLTSDISFMYMGKRKIAIIDAIYNDPEDDFISKYDDFIDPLDQNQSDQNFKSTDNLLGDNIDPQLQVDIKKIVSVKYTEPVKNQHGYGDRSFKQSDIDKYNKLIKFIDLNSIVLPIMDKISALPIKENNKNFLIREIKNIYLFNLHNSNIFLTKFKRKIIKNEDKKEEDDRMKRSPAIGGGGPSNYYLKYLKYKKKYLDLKKKVDF